MICFFIINRAISLPFILQRIVRSICEVPYKVWLLLLPSFYWLFFFLSVSGKNKLYRRQNCLFSLCFSMNDNNSYSSTELWGRGCAFFLSLFWGWGVDVLFFRLLFFGNLQTLVVMLTGGKGTASQRFRRVLSTPNI